MGATARDDARRRGGEAVERARRRTASRRTTPSPISRPDARSASESWRSRRASRRCPQAKDVVLRPRTELTHLGKPLPLLDGPAYVTGQAIYGADIKLPGMLTAVIARPPVGGRQSRAFRCRRERWPYRAFAK